MGNTAVSVRVFSPGDEGPVTQLNDASAVADAGGPGVGDTTARSRTAYANTSVSIRVASPGSAAQVSQQSETNAEGSTAVAVTTGSVDAALTVTVAGPDLERPGPAGLVIWEWTWTWQDDEAAALDLTATAVSSWDWNWNASAGASNGSNGRGNVTSRTLAPMMPDARPGRGSGAGSGHVVCRTGRGCGTGMRRCQPVYIWIWNWNWTWTGQPPVNTGACRCHLRFGAASRDS